MKHSTSTHIVKGSIIGMNIPCFCYSMPVIMIEGILRIGGMNEFTLKSVIVKSNFVMKVRTLSIP